MILPVIHLNGSSAARLAETYKIAIISLETALNRLAEAAPNGRDYYPLGESAFEEAREEHFARIKKLETVRDEFAELWSHCDGQVKR